MSSTPTIPPPADPAITSIPGAAPNGPVPVPGAPILAFDNTLGALYIGSTLSMLLYGIICLQMFLYITSTRTKKDSRWTKLFVSVNLAIDTANQATITASIYKFLVSDYLNPFALPSGGAGSGEIFTYAHSLIGACGVLFIQLFFSWRIWAFSGASLNFRTRILIPTLTVILALFSFGCSVDLAITGFNHRLLSVNTPDFILAYRLSSSSRVAFDLFMTFAMTLTLYRSRSGVKRTDHVITLLIMFTVNTNLLTTLLSISELVTFIALPKATVYGGLGFLSPKLYFNTLLASLNSREYMRNELVPADSVISSSQLAISTGTKGLGTYSSALSFPGSGLVKKLLRVDESTTFIASKKSEGDAGSYEMAPQPPVKQPELVEMYYF
ncbi:hypothetical protein BDN71DRAFT_1447997 [Pleurotus eryngii]|uniref:DUF6534 domain-containing protein n=1 Tax=Pleurotus eryngii TaxID=5323 RepID=A0A9P6A0L5_PLEER|nr:hypothetical protein BDN71DRAFT_1447997 [Pleurotus eryngii]